MMEATECSPTSDSKEIGNRNNMQEIVECILSLTKSIRTRTKNTNTKQNAQ